jgi:hypothetical protein
MFNDDDLQSAKESSENAKKSVAAFIRQFEQQRPYITELFNRMGLLMQKSNTL